MGLKRASGLAPSPHHSCTICLDPQLNWRCIVLPMLQSLVQKTISGTTPDSVSKTLRSLLLLRYSQLNGMIPAIHESNYVVTPSPRSKCYNTPISKRAVMGSDRSLCMAISTIKRRDLGSYENSIMCRLCNYGDPKYLQPQ